MSDNNKTQAEDLKKLEDAAYFELCQIIAEAMQYQDVELLNSRISAWKTKYKKLLDGSPANSKFKKKIEFLLTQYYSSVTQYILNQLKLKEEKMIENQAKAIRRLYSIIRDTNDLDLLKKKVKQWEQKYPISAFLKMYQKRIKLYTREKNLKENAFEQEKAFHDLVAITKINGTLDELKYKLNVWEKSYSINDKYNIDDFLKHQSEIKRFTSDEFLQSIAREENNNDSKNNMDILEQYNNKSSSSLSVQASAYAALLKISKSPNAVDQMFMWVYKNRYIKFNDKYKELILSATYLEYSPTYLNNLPKPKMYMSKNSLSFDEFTNINDIKRYAIISYFNLLLPPGKAISNDYFNKYIQIIYAKSEMARISDLEENSTSIEETLDTGIEISLRKPMQQDKKSYMSEIDLEPKEPPTDEDIKTAEDVKGQIKTVIDLKNAKHEEIQNKETVSEEIDNVDIVETVIYKSSSESDLSIDFSQPQDNTSHLNRTEEIISTVKQQEFPGNGENFLNHYTIVATAPLFFETIYNYNKQAVLIDHINSAVIEYLESEKVNEFSLNESFKIKSELE